VPGRGQIATSLRCSDNIEMSQDEDRSTLLPRLPRCFFVDSREESVGELTLDTTMLKEVWGDQQVSLALASMLKAVMEGRVSSSEETTTPPSAGVDDEAETLPGEEEEEDEDEDEEDDTQEVEESEKEARLALVEVFECFCSGMKPVPRHVHVLNVDSLLSRREELMKARSVTPETSSSSSSSPSPEPGGGATASISSTPILLRFGKDGERVIDGEEETVSKMLDLVCKMRGKHQLPPLEQPESSGDHAMTFGIVAADRSSPNNRRDPDEEWLLVGRESASETALEDSVYPIRSIYSFFVVLNSGTVIQSSSSPSESEESLSSSSSGSMSNDDDDSSGSGSGSSSSQQSTSDSTVFTAVKQHEDCAWSVLAAIHATGPETIEGAKEGSETTTACPDLVVVDDPLHIINEYVRYLQGDDAPPRSGDRKRRRVHVHEKILGRETCRIRILTTGDESKDYEDETKAEQHKKRKELIQARLVQEQQELMQLLEQKLRQLQQSHELASSSSSGSESSSDSPSPRQ